MSEISTIEWTDATWNPVTGCTKISRGCDNCYAFTFAERWRGVPEHPYEQGFDLKLWPERVLLPLEWHEPRRIFVNSMSDLYHEKVPDSFIHRVFDTMNSAPQHAFQILTKRAKRLLDIGPSLRWAPNIWQGVSVETADYQWRIDALRRVPAKIRFLSLEPLLGPLPRLNLRGIHWVIAGGESGPGARPMQAAWAEEIRRQCRRADVPFFFKQYGTLRSNPNPQDPTAKENGGSSKGGRTLKGRVWSQFPALVVPRRPRATG
ncbi:MAG TPA: phage Gp37/Gp68 family protein [Thermoplasmata archaeon]|nr:phage Gp37/Gp68 family protein [Thermoplasmata archaeon]